MNSPIPRYCWSLFAVIFGLIFFAMAVNDYQTISEKEFQLFDAALVIGKLGLGVSSLGLSLFILIWNKWVIGFSAVFALISICCIAYCALVVKPVFGAFFILGLALLALWGLRTYQTEKKS